MAGKFWVDCGAGVFSVLEPGGGGIQRWDLEDWPSWNFFGILKETVSKRVMVGSYWDPPGLWIVPGPISRASEISSLSCWLLIKISYLIDWLQTNNTGPSSPFLASQASFLHLPFFPPNPPNHPSHCTLQHTHWSPRKHCRFSLVPNFFYVDGEHQEAV